MSVVGPIGDKYDLKNYFRMTTGVGKGARVEWKLWRKCAPATSQSQL